MMSDLSNKTALVIDHGLFLPVARRLADSFKRVLYFSPWEVGFPRVHQCVIGDGFDNIERCDDIWKVKNEVDLFVFPDIHHSGVQLELESQGYAVWGSRGADSLEINRQKLMRTLGEIGLEVPPHVVITGLTALREHLKDKKDLYIKVSKFRGSFETAHWRSWDEDECTLDCWAVEFGPTKDLVRFLVFEPIGDAVEIGGDTYCVDGQWPSLILRADESKDKAYIAAVTKREEMPEQIKAVMEAFSPFLAEHRYRNQWSMELRGEGDKWYFIDATCRGGLPSTASQLALWKNFPEIVWAGAHGELVEPEPAAKFSVEVCLCLKGEKGYWRKASIPAALSDVIKLSGCCMIDGMACFPPDDNRDDEIGWLQANGDTIEEAIDTVKDYATKLPDGVSAKTEALVDLLKEIKAAEEVGVPFSSQTTPEPATVVTDA